MELSLSLGADMYGAAKRETCGSSGIRGGLMEFCSRLGISRRSLDDVSVSSTKLDRDRLLDLPSIEGKRTKRDHIETRSKERTTVAKRDKVLRLSGEQTAFLEQSFKQRHTLSCNRKLDIAKQLNLRPRQVEVWFQNRRARTKLKQIEEEWAYLRRQCKFLSEENIRLQQELFQLKSVEASLTVHHPAPSATPINLCPSCKRVFAASVSN